MEVNGAPELLCFPHSSEYLPLCSAEQRHSDRFGTTWGWVNDDRIFIFGWTIPLRCFVNTGPVLLSQPRSENKVGIEALSITMGLFIITIHISRTSIWGILIRAKALIAFAFQNLGLITCANYSCIWLTSLFVPAVEFIEALSVSQSRQRSFKREAEMWNRRPARPAVNASVKWNDPRHRIPHLADCNAGRVHEPCKMNSSPQIIVTVLCLSFKALWILILLFEITCRILI